MGADVATRADNHTFADRGPLLDNDERPDVGTACNARAGGNAGAGIGAGRLHPRRMQPLCHARKTGVRIVHNQGVAGKGCGILRCQDHGAGARAAQFVEVARTGDKGDVARAGAV
jgi:hypothetical protein